MAGGTASGVLDYRPSLSRKFLKAALPPSRSRTGRRAEQGVHAASRWSRFHPTTTPGPAAAVDPLAWTGRRGARRSFWDVGPQGLTVGVPRQKVRWPIPLMCLVPSAGRMVTATTETRGVAVAEFTLVARGNLSKTAAGQDRNSGVRALTLVSINGFGDDVCLRLPLDPFHFAGQTRCVLFPSPLSVSASAMAFISNRLMPLLSSSPASTPQGCPPSRLS